MADDIVTRKEWFQSQADLVTQLRWFEHWDIVGVVCTAAADEIERLRADLAEAYDACRYALANSPRWRENAATVVATWQKTKERH